MIGAKTVTMSLLLLIASAVGSWIGLSPARLASLGAADAFWTGLFAFLAGSMVHRYWRLHEKSAQYFRISTDDGAWVDEAHFLGTPHHRILIGDNHGDAFDFSGRVQHAICVVLAFWTGLVTLDTRAVELLSRLPEKLAEGGSEWCPAHEEVKTEVAVDPGCALIRRAFELGYAKNLGPCEPKQEEVHRICTLRQRDEPFLHYAWRRLDAFHKAAAAETSSERIDQMKRSLQKRRDHLEELYAANGFTVAGSPRSSHHIFTNLPDPGSGWFEKRGCLEHYRKLPHRFRSTEKNASSRFFDHVLGQLLFDTRYAAPAGSCREYTIHWGAPPDACDRLQRDPQRFLDEQGATGEVRGVLERYRVTVELQDVADARGMSALSSILKSVPPNRFIGLHCFVEEERAEVVSSSRELMLDGTTLIATEIRIPKGGVEAERYHQVAAMLVPSFAYGTLLSNASPGELLDTGVDAKFFVGQYGFMSRLDYLADVDIFLGNQWLEERNDLMDVYPYHVHLLNYVRLFRARYRSERGRL